MRPEGTVDDIKSVANNQGTRKMRSKLQLWYDVTRPYSLPATSVPVIVGTDLAWYHGQVDGVLFLLALFGSVSIQIGANLANEYLDYVQGIDRGDSLGPAGVILRGELAPKQIFWATVLAFFASVMFGSYFVFIYGWPILLLGVVSILAAWFYTAKPLSLGYRALGEIEEFTFMGPVIVVASYYVQVGSLALTPILVSLLVGMLVLPILHANNLRDVVQDDERNRLTWVVLAYRRFGAEKGKVVSIGIYCLSITGAYVMLLVLTLTHHMPLWSLLALLTIPEAYAMIKFVRSGVEGKPLNRLVRGTARLELLFGIMLTIGYALDIFLHPR